MMQNKRWLIAFISISIASLFLGHETRANTVTASSCNESDVSSALSKAGNGDTVVIPAGTCTWTTSLSFTAAGSISIMGAGSQSTVGGGDQTIIIDNVSRSSSDVPTFAVITGAAQTVVRISGLTFEQNASSSQTFNGIVRIAGSSQNFRFDHNHFILFSGNPPNICMNIFNWVYGVIDHNLFDLNQKTVNNGVRISHGTMNGDTSGNGNGSWSAPTNFGSNAFIFLEDNVFNGGFGNDCNAGGRQVIRHNTLNDSNLQAHEMENDLRGCRAAELYANIFNGNYSGGDNIDSTFAYETRMGTTLIWGNVLTNQRVMISMQNDRTNTGHGFATTPNGWGYCGTATTGAGSAWDFSSTGSVGYPCIDQVGRGVSQTLSGVFPNKVNSATGRISWANNALEPVYEWLDQWNAVDSGAVCSSSDTNTIAPNRDYFCYTKTWNGSAFTGPAFDGTSGTGSGLLASRPSTCALNVAYWATDTNTLYQCSSTNTWTSYYTPYTYPHPLTIGSGGTSGAPPAPTNLGTTVNNGPGD